MKSRQLTLTELVKFCCFMTLIVLNKHANDVAQSSRCCSLTVFEPEKAVIVNNEVMQDLNQLMFSEGKMIVTCCCTIFGVGAIAGWSPLGCGPDTITICCNTFNLKSILA